MMRSTIILGLLMAAVFSGTIAADGTMTPPATVGMQSLTGFGGSAGAHEFFLQSGSSWKGDLTGIGAGQTWSLVVLGIDATGVSGPADRFIYFNLQDADDGSHFKNLGIDFYLDATGASGGTLFQCYQQWTSEGSSSHGLNVGELTANHFDLKFEFTKAMPVDGWTVTPSYRLDGGVWTLFFDGGFTATVGDIDFSAGKLVVGFDGGADGTVSFDNYYLAGPAGEVFIDDDWATMIEGDPVQFPGEAGFHTMGVDAFAVIQEGIDSPASSVVHVADGTYSEALNIDTRDALSIEGESRIGTIMMPLSTYFWNVPGYESRRAAVRIVDCPDVDFSSMTFDFDIIKGNNVAGFLYWNSAGEISDNLIENMTVSDAGGGYYEITSYFRAPDYTDTERAFMHIHDNTFVNTGRLAICTHVFVDALIENNIFIKDIDDFGYAMEIGSASTATITGNTISGFKTAAGDASSSAGIFIENSFTQAYSGLSKPVTVTGNEIYDCSSALYVGNGFDGFAGDVDIIVEASGNNLHDNLGGGVTVVDEDKENGSSVTVWFHDNIVENNNVYGYYFYTKGDGDITANLENETITGHNYGIVADDSLGAATASSYDLNIHWSRIYDNSSRGIANGLIGWQVDAINNYWGDYSGPYNESTNPGGTGNSVTDNVDYVPWCNVDFTFCEYPIICGNANDDELVNVADAVFIINYVFKQGAPPDPLCMGNANGDADVNVADAVHLINHVFKDGPAPVEPCCP